MTKKISIIIPCYNYAERVPYAIESVVKQMTPYDELILINDGSTDNTNQILKTFDKKYPGKLQVFNQKNGGAGSARNKGIERSQGNYLLFLDADDELMPGALAKFHQSIKSQPSVDLFLAAHQSIDEKGKVREHQAGCLLRTNTENIQAYWDNRISMSHGAFAAKRVLFERIRYPEGIRNGEDIPVFTHLLAVAKILMIPSVTVKVHKHADSLRNQVSTDDADMSSMVKAVFNPELLPPLLMEQKRWFIARRQLSLSRGLFASRDYRQARSCYCQAIRSAPCLLFKWSYLRKFFKTFFKTRN